ncbi:hypothetical protein F2Q70_00028839 [Brassica cretica]|uniref:Uncharacterized protein n=2 Tax=Brassica cretica TaxID=69181 RepID=A0A8S9LB34_BRACR|nr:hypothetical protein F2Q68_00028406 [Brassica cretica]KAF2603291.1 hypothetical protein F2Q70_00028839 [Brassica cretica]KAF3557661.1 hypothetical protein F2Q69_00018025 [Brassica cretica]KAF3581652.1 hypothetical protein DY000_02035984 [Brassica cretica]
MSHWEEQLKQSEDTPAAPGEYELCTQDTSTVPPATDRCTRRGNSGRTPLIASSSLPPTHLGDK